MEPVSDAGLNVSCCMYHYGSWLQVLLNDRFQGRLERLYPERNRGLPKRACSVIRGSPVRY
jgi:hypothetical protein